MNNKAKIHYYDIGDYLNREQKLEIVKKYGSVTNVPWQELQPNEHGDWISVRNDAFANYIPLAPEKKFDLATKTFFILNSLGINSNRDAWVYNFSKSEIDKNMYQMIEFYNQQVNEFILAQKSNPNLKVEDFIHSDATKISWTRALRNDATKNITHLFTQTEMRYSTYRPFCKQQLYFADGFIESPGLNSMLFPNKSSNNIVICISPSSNDGLSLLISNEIANLHFNGDTQCFPLYYYEENKSTQKGLFDEGSDQEYIRRDGVSNFILERAKKQYGKNVSKEDVFYYVYGFLHSPQYRETFANDLKKMLPRLPLVDDVRDFWAFSKAGRLLADLHLNYETVDPYKGVITLIEPLTITETLKQANKDELEYVHYRVDKMRFPKKGQKDTIIYNSQISITNIPSEAYEYVVNGKSAIEWIMERYAITTHKESGIKNDPNDWATEVGKPRYILDLLLSIINVSVQTVEIVKGLPKVEFE